jgi:NAD(P)-dependent dehydrogenase (short-subunit alcohol dehydrogenase family)
MGEGSRVSGGVREELRFNDEVVVVSGAGRGLGRTYAELLAARGARVVVNDLGVDVSGGGQDSSPADETTERIRSGGGNAIASHADIATAAGADAVVHQAIQTFGRLDVVINNAGIFNPRGFTETDAEHMRRHLDVHVLGSLNLTRAAWPHLIASPNPRAVLVTSVAMLGIPGYVSYGTAKAALIGMTMNLAVAGEEHGIGVNAVLPVADTRMALAGGVTQEELDARSVEEKHRQRPEGVASLVAFLAHAACSENGRIYEAGHGRYARIFIAECQGYVNDDASVEDIWTNWVTINDEAGYCVPNNAFSSLTWPK